MISNQVMAWSGRCYGLLMSLYPAEFRVHFGKEMRQIFIDCCRDAEREDGLSGLIGLWLRTACDLGVSIPRERGRVLMEGREFGSRTAGLIDSFVIGAIIVFHLFVAGAGIASYFGRYVTAADFFTLATLAASALGGLGVVCSLILARFRRIHYRLIELD